MDWVQWQSSRSEMRKLKNSESNEVPPKASTLTWETNSRSHILQTAVQPRYANHSYNGIMFSMEGRGIEDLEILSFSIGGELGLTRIYVTDLSWLDVDKDESSWTLVANESITGRKRYSQAWSEPYEMKLLHPVLLPSGVKKGFYIHVEVDHDRGLLYQSYKRFDEEIASDGLLKIFPGKGHTSNFPFDESGGWWRTVRGLAGSVTYRTIRKTWHWKTHRQFPKEFRNVIVTLLLCKSREECVLFHGMPNELLWHLFEWLDWKWWEDVQNKEESQDEDFLEMDNAETFYSELSWNTARNGLSELSRSG